MARQYLLDTNICVFYMRGMFDMNKKISAAGIDNCYLSDITVADFILVQNIATTLLKLWE